MLQRYYKDNFFTRRSKTAVSEDTCEAANGGFHWSAVEIDGIIEEFYYYSTFF